MEPEFVHTFSGSVSYHFLIKIIVAYLCGSEFFFGMSHLKILKVF